MAPSSTASRWPQAIAWTLAGFVFEIPYGPRLSVWIAGALGGAALVTAFGWLSLRGVLNTSPGRVLQSPV